MKRWRLGKFENWFKENYGEDKQKYIINDINGLRVVGEKEIIAEIYHDINIENDSSVQDYSYYIEKFSVCPYSMVSLYNEFREGSGEEMHITSFENFKLDELLGHDTDLDFEKMKNLSYEEIAKIEEDEDEDAWIIWELILLLKDVNK